MNKLKFIEFILAENLPDWNVIFVNGKEGFCDKKKERIHIGKKAKGSYFKWLVLHEITHALINDNHYSDEFRVKMNELCKKYKVKYKNNFYD